MENIGFQRHPSKVLNDLYRLKNYQGADPENAKILFVGKDPNWAIDIEDLPIFNLVEDYLSNGIRFWKQYNIHHPFLHPKYNGDGKKYHKAVSRLKLNSNLSNEISFVELIGFPTTGMSSTNQKQFNEYLLSNENRNHLIELDSHLKNTDKHLFIFWGLIKHLKFINSKIGLFENIVNLDQSKMIRTDLNEVGNIYIHKHFSMGISSKTLSKISKKVIQILGENSDCSDINKP